MRRSFLFRAVWLLLLAVPVTWGVYFLSAPLEREEILRIANPAGTIEAVVAEVQTNATVATPTEIYLVPKGAKISGEPVFRADRLEGLEVSWSSDAALVVSAKKARMFKNIIADTLIGKPVAIEYNIQNPTP